MANTLQPFRRMLPKSLTLGVSSFDIGPLATPHVKRDIVPGALQLLKTARCTNAWSLFAVLYCQWLFLFSTSASFMVLLAM